MERSFFMERVDSPLKNIRVASPCSADWSAMSGDERKRFCGDCKLNVYNLSGMTTYDAENLLRNSEGRLCVRYFQRKDGTVITKDCPVGWARVKERGILAATAALSVVLALLSGIVMLVGTRRDPQLRKRIELILDSTVPEPAIMGNIAMPDRRPKPGSEMGKYVPMGKEAVR
jgi:hypothetical protein